MDCYQTPPEEYSDVDLKWLLKSYFASRAQSTRIPTVTVGFARNHYDDDPLPGLYVREYDKEMTSKTAL